jgi:amino acid adenylation domain-containing protein
MSGNSNLVHERFREIADASPTRPALRFRGYDAWETWTYAELARRSNEIALQLALQGVGAGQAVGVVALRHPDTVAALIAILKVGGSYVPLEAAYPPDRLRLLCEDADVRIILAAGETTGAFPSVPADTLSLSKVPARPEAGTHESFVAGISTGDAAYVMFTSGSTGVPKGVVVPHRAIARLVSGPNFMDLNEQTSFLHLAPLSFDASTLELWAPLLNGGVCVLYPEDQLPTPFAIRTVVAEAQVNCMWMTASLFNNVVDQDPRTFTGLKCLLIGGEALSVPHVLKALRALPKLQLINGYGPTENTTFTTCHRIQHVAEDTVRIPIGIPVSGTQVMLVDQDLQPVPQGEEGELLALGDGVALGYLNKPDLTSERFVQVTLSSGNSSRAYRTGDRARQRSDGLIEFLGRYDDQVKIDGHRIEPGEIERVIESVPAVRECRVLLRKGPAGQKRLAAYVAVDGQEVQCTLRHSLSRQLPAYMIPHFIYCLDRFPTNANGKLDISALPDPFSAAAVDGAAPAELDIVRTAWTEILGRLPETSDTNFFDAGGTSLEAIRLHEILQLNADRKLAGTFVFEHPTIAGQQAELYNTVRQQSAGDARGTLRRAALSRRNHGRRL